ncbi:MAG: hypothetical protein K8F24_10405 [Bacteroidales bacterium]|nr:hypothetical protein [Bacteroidales bacterium]
MQINQYGKALFELDTANFQSALKTLQPRFPQFLAADLNDPANIQQLYDFISDTFLISLNGKVRAIYPDVAQLEKVLLPVYQRFSHYYPDIQLAPVFTYISGINHEMPVIVGEGAIVVGLDCYLGADSPQYMLAGIPKYRSLRMSAPYLPRDFAAAVYDAYLPAQELPSTILDEMVQSGKKLLFIEAMIPTISDEVLLGYTSEQLEWARHHVGDIWAFLVGDKLLYSNDFEVFKKLFADGPFSREFDQKAPARLGEFIGLQMIRSYAENQDDFCPKRLIKKQDAQQILIEARYKPAK